MPNMALTCPVCGMGFMTLEALNSHTKMGHVTEKVSKRIGHVTKKVPKPMTPAKTMPLSRKKPRNQYRAYHLKRHPLPVWNLIRCNVQTAARPSGVIQRWQDIEIQLITKQKGMSKKPPNLIFKNQNKKNPKKPSKQKNNPANSAFNTQPPPKIAIFLQFNVR